MLLFLFITVGVILLIYELAEGGAQYTNKSVRREKNVRKTNAGLEVKLLHQYIEEDNMTIDQAFDKMVVEVTKQGFDAPCTQKCNVKRDSWYPYTLRISTDDSLVVRYLQRFYQMDHSDSQRRFIGTREEEDEFVYNREWIYDNPSHYKFFLKSMDFIYKYWIYPGTFVTHKNKTYEVVGHDFRPSKIGAAYLLRDVITNEEQWVSTDFYSYIKEL